MHELAACCTRRTTFGFRLWCQTKFNVYTSSDWFLAIQIKLWFETKVLSFDFKEK